MKRILFAFVLLCSVCSAQEYYVPRASHQQKHSYNHKDSAKGVSYFFSFDFGVSVPQREFASRDTTRNFMIFGPDSTNAKGFANVGFHAGTSGGIFITPYFGLCAKIAYNENTFDDATLNLLVNGKYTYTINDDYTIWQFMGGAFVNYPLGKRSSLWMSGMVGLINVNFPSFSIYNLPQNVFPPYLSWNFTLPNASDFAYCFSLMYEQGISQNVSLTGSICYTGSELIYPSLTYNFTGPYLGLPPPYTQNTPVTMSFGSLDISVGMLFHF